jgi:hypothetical protein
MESKIEKRRQSTFFKISAERWLTSSTRFELTAEQRAIWIDVLAFGALFGGVVEIGAIKTKSRVKANFKPIAQQLNVDEGSVEAAFRLYEGSGKLHKTYDKKEVKFYYEIMKWEEYQSPFLWGEPGKKGKKGKKDPDEHNVKKNVSPFSLLEEIKREKIKGVESDLPPLPKNLAFKVQDELKTMRAELLANRREGARLLADPVEMKRKGFTKEDIEAKLERQKKEFVDKVEDYS